MPSKSKSQQRLMGMVYAYKNGKLDLDDLSPSLASKIKEITDGKKRKTGDKRRKTKGISEEDAKKYASTKHKGLPEKIEERLITKFDKFVNEGIRDLLKPMNKDEIIKKFNKLDSKGKLKVVSNNYHLKTLINDDEINKLIEENDEITTYDDVIGKIIIDINVDRDDEDNNKITFKFKNGDEYLMCHYDDCCEQVFIDDIVGDIGDLIGSPLIKAEEIYRDNPFEKQQDHGSWTFYKFATIKGYVDIVWKGLSNGYYSERVSFIKKNK